MRNLIISHIWFLFVLCSDDKKAGVTSEGYTLSSGKMKHTEVTSDGYASSSSEMKHTGVTSDGYASSSSEMKHTEVTSDGYASSSSEMKHTEVTSDGYASSSSDVYQHTKPQATTNWYSGITTKIVTSNKNADITEFSTLDSSSLHPVTSAITGASAAIGILLVFIIFSLCFLILAILKRKNKRSLHLSNGETWSAVSSLQAHRSPNIALRENATTPTSYVGIPANSHSGVNPPPDYYDEEKIEIENLDLSSEDLQNPFYGSANERKSSCDDDPPNYEAISDLCGGEMNSVCVRQSIDENKDLNYFILQKSQSEEVPPPILRRSQSEGNILNAACFHVDGPQAASKMEFSMIGDYFSSITKAASYLAVERVSEDNCGEEETNLWIN